MPTRRVYEHWFLVPKPPTTPRPRADTAAARARAPRCACGCGRRILSVAEETGDPYRSRDCLERHLTAYRVRHE